MPAIKLDFDVSTRKATYTFGNGKTLIVGNMTEAKAQRFLERDAPEFEKRDLRLASVDGQFTREENDNGGSSQ